VTAQLPELYWYLFWAAALVLAIVFGLYVATVTHRRNMKALEILKTYAEKGAEPPAPIAELLTKQMLGSQAGTAAKLRDRAELLRSFIGFLFSACVMGGIHYWLADAEAPSWAIHGSKAAMAFFGFGAFGLLLATLLTREK
jgi:hypothetical protein